MDRVRIFLLTALAIGVVACQTAPAPAPQAAPEQAAATTVTVIGLSDFHGWLLPLEPKGLGKYYGGIANLGAMLELGEKLDPKTSLILDNGDMWTGPTISTFLRGEPVIEAYNRLGVSAANVANHEFDYGLDVLKTRVKEARFPFLGANIRQVADGMAPTFVKPWIIEERAGVKVGIIGLTYEKTDETTLARHVEGLVFQDYATTLARVLPEIREAGAEAIVVLFHDTVPEIEKVFAAHPEFEVDAVVAGQDHRQSAKLVNGIPIVNPGAFGRSYVRFAINFDPATRSVVSVDHTIVPVTGEVGAPAYPPIADLAAVTERARQRARALSNERLGRINKPLPVGNFQNSPLGHFVVDSWLAAFPEVDVAMCNHGGLRQPLPAGPLTLADVTGVQPFENNLYIVKITGAQLKGQLSIDHPVVGGLSWKYRTKANARQVVNAVDRLGQPIEDERTYKVIINDFMYFGGDGYGFRALDQDPEDTGLSWREPVIRALRLAEATGRAVEGSTSPRAALAAAE